MTTTLALTARSSLFCLAKAALWLLAIAAVVPCPLAVSGQLSVTNYSFTVAPSSNYANQNLTVLTNGTDEVSVWPNTADNAQLVGWFTTNPGIQFNFTGGQSVSEVTVWAANSKGSAGVWLPFTVTIQSGSYSKTLTVTPPAGSGTTVPLTITGISAATDAFTITAGRNTTGSPGGWTMFSEVQFFGTGAKADNTTALNLASSWTGNQAPVSTDVVLFNSTFTGTTALDTGAAVDWAGMKVTGGSGTLTLDPASTANRLGVGSSGIDLSAATRDVRLTDLRLTGSTAQPWSIATGRSLTVGADSLAQNAGANPTLSGAGTLVKEGAATGLTLGSLASFTGTLDVQAGSVATSAANQLSTNYTVSLAAAGTLQLGGNDTLPTSMNSGSGTVEILQSNVLTITNSADRTVNRIFSGTGSITKTGTGVLTLSGASSHSGGTSLGTGTIKLGSNTALGSGAVTVNGDGSTLGGSLDLNGTTISNDIDLQGSNSGMGNVGSLQNTNTGTAAVLNGGLIVGEDYVGGNGDVVINGVVSSTASLGSTYSIYKQGSGTWTFANTANTFDGFYYIVGGTTAVTKLANQGQTSSLGQPSTSTANRVVFVSTSGGVLRFEGSTASTSDRGFVLNGGTAATNNVIEAAGTSAAATLTLTGGLSAGANAAYTARLAGSNAGVNTYAGVIANGSGTVALEKDGTTTWALTNANTYSGATTVTAGTLKVGNGGTAGTLGGGAVSVVAGATLVFDRTDAGLAVANVISGAGTIEQAGSGTTALTGANTFTGPTTISAGTLSVGNGGSTGTLGSGSVAIAAGARLAINRTGAVTLANAISGDGGVTKLGSGTLTLSGTSSYTGGTNLAAGTLVVGSDDALGTGPLTFTTAGATLQTARDIANVIAVNANGALSTGTSNVELSGSFTGSGTLTKTGTGTLTLSGTSSTFTGDLVISGGSGANSTVKAGSANAFGSGTITILGGGGNTGSTFDLNGFSLDNGLVIGQQNSGVGNAGALQNNGATPAVLNGPVSSGGEVYVGGAGNITFNGIVSGGVNPANAYSFYKDGAGTWTFANTANTFDGFYYVFDGTTEVASLANLNEPSSLGQPTDANRNRVVFGFNGAGGGTLRFNGSAASTSDRVFVMAGSTAAADSTIEAAGTSAAATLTLTGGLSANRAGSYTARLAGDNAGVNEYRGVIANGSGTVALEKTGTTTWALTGTNTYSGATTVTAGTLKVGTGGTAGTLGGGGVSVATAATLAFDRSDAGLAISNAISGDGRVVQVGSGTTTLSGANTFTGGTTISAGTLAVSQLADSGTSNLGISGTLALTGGTLLYTGAGAATTARVVDLATATTTSTINVSDAGGSLTLTGKVWNSDAAHPNVVLNKTGSGTLEIAGAGSNTNTSLVATAGTTLLNATTRAVYEIRALDTGATVRLAQANQVFNGDALPTTGNIRMTGGTLDLAGNAQEISRLTGSTNATAGTGTITSALPATFTVGNNLAGRPSIFDGSLTGALAVITRGTNPITLGGASTYTGTTTVTGSRLAVNGSLGNTAVTVSAGTLGGSGSIAGTVVVQSGATLAPGNSIESLAAGATSFASGATFAYEVDSSAALGVAADLLVVSGNLDIASGTLLEFADIAGTAAPFQDNTTVFAMINYTGTWNGGLFSYNGNPLNDGSRFTVGSQQWEIDYNYQIGGPNIQPLNFTADQNTGGSYVTITAVPEPATLALIAIGTALAAFAARRRRA